MTTTRMSMGYPVIVQYWRSFAHLEAFARDRDDPHLAAWRNYYGRHGKTGIWHETYLVPAGQYEAVYANMPAAFGLGRAGRQVPMAGASHARDRVTAAGGAP
ncbi:MAG TPA: phenylacetaldoxime dehydratase family protein [Actinomycetospora sp.]|uniref:monooxygenase family protein n=1 Tax=Actinomycetospora sp. TaxID=1872135 RepID=UPI002F42B7F0